MGLVHVVFVEDYKQLPAALGIGGVDAMPIFAAAATPIQLFTLACSWASE
jgi:hypothetical protein